MHVEDPEDLIREFIAAFNTGDLEGLARDLYEEDVVVVPGPAPDVMSGRAAVVRGLEPVLATGGKMSLASVVAIRNGDLALTHTKVRLTLPGQEPMEAPCGRPRSRGVSPTVHGAMSSTTHWAQRSLMADGVRSERASPRRQMQNCRSA